MPNLATDLARVMELLARAYEVVRHDVGCPSIGGNGDTDCKCDAVPFLRDLESALQSASGGDSALMALERFGRAPAGSPYLLVPMDDGYWTPWHIAQKALDESRLNEPFGNAEQLASLEQQARALFEAQADPLAAPWDRQWEPTKQYWRNKAAALANQQGVGGWQPIQTAPRNGDYVLVANSHGAWIAKWNPVYQSGYRPSNPWKSMMLNHDHIEKPGRYDHPTHWMPLPAAPTQPAGDVGSGND